MSSTSSPSYRQKPSAKRTTLTPGRLALRQVRMRSLSYVPVAIGLAAALALAVAVTLTQARTEDASLAQTVSGLGGRGLVSVRLTGVRQVDDYQKFQVDVQLAVREQNSLVSSRSTMLYAAPFTPKTINDVTVDRLGQAYASSVVPLQIAVLEDLQSHVDLVAGSWPARPKTGETIEVTLPENAITAARLKLGDKQCMGTLPPFTYSVCVHVSGIWRTRDPTSAYWGQDQQPPVAGFTDDATFFSVVNAENAIDIHPQLASVATVTLAPDVSAIRAAGADASLAQLRRLHADFGVARPDAVVVTSLESALDQYVNESAIAAFAVDLVAAQLLLIALYCVWFLAGALLVQRRQVIAVWRSRGWSWLGVTRLLFMELFTAAIVATPIGIALGWVASDLAARSAYHQAPTFIFDLKKLGPPILVMVVLELVLLAVQATLAARHGVLRSRSDMSRPPTPWWRRRFIDLLLGVIAIPLLIEVSFLGNASVRAAGAVSNPVTLILPGLAIAFLALAFLRLLPVAAVILVRIPRSTSARLAGIQLLRAPGQHAGLAVLLMVAVALGVFASAYATTASRNQADRAAYETGSDVRGTFSGALSAVPDQIPTDGASARSSVFRSFARTGGEEVQMLAVDPYTFAPVMYTRPDLGSAPLPDLVQLLADRETGGIQLPNGATSVSIWVHGSDTAGDLSADFVDARGRPVRADFGSLAFTGWKHLTAAVAASTGRLRFRDLAVSGVTSAGEIGLSAFTAGSTLIEPFNEPYPVFGNQLNQNDAVFPFLWWRSDWNTGSLAETLLASGDIPRGADETVHFRVIPAHIPTYVRPPLASPNPSQFFAPPPGATCGPPGGAPPGPVPPGGQPPCVAPNFGPGAQPQGPIPAIISSGLAAKYGLSVGKSMQVDVDHIGVTATIVAVTTHFPSLYPELEDFIVLARDPLMAALAYGGHQRPWPNEIWGRSLPGSMDTLVGSMKKAPGVVEVFDRRAVQSAAAHNPHQLELESNLLLGFIASIGLGVLALALHFFVLGRSRLSDHAVLEANGVPQRVVRRSMLVEEIVLVVFCAVCGALLGLIASESVLPGLQLGGSVFDNVPSTVLTFDPTLIAGVVAAVFVVSLLAGLMISAVTQRPRIMSELRAFG